MRNYIAVIFGDRRKAYKGLHALWQLDDDAETTVHGTAVIHRDGFGEIHVDTKETHPVLGTAVGVGIGALLGALAGPAGAAIGASGGAALGAATGGVVGAAVDLDRADTRRQAADETRFTLGIGQAAVIAEVTEDSTTPIDRRMHELGGRVYRRSKADLQDDSWFAESEYYPYYENYLYPYEYVPSAYM